MEERYFQELQERKIFSEKPERNYIRVQMTFNKLKQQRTSIEFIRIGTTNDANCYRRELEIQMNEITS